MKIRCQNCYRILDKNEEYCKSCGAHSEQMQKAMATGNYGGAPLDRFKMGALLFLILAFFGNGIIMVTLAVIKKDSSTDLFKYSYSLLFSICDSHSHRLEISDFPHGIRLLLSNISE